MKPFSYYSEVDFIYPNKEDYRRYAIYKRGKCISGEEFLTKETFLEFMSKYANKSFDNFIDAKSQAKSESLTIEEFFVNYAYDKHKFEYNKALNDKGEEFKRDLFYDLGISENPKREMLYAKAYEMGHSSGYSEIYSVACDLVDLIL